MVVENFDHLLHQSTRTRSSTSLSYAATSSVHAVPSLVLSELMSSLPALLAPSNTAGAVTSTTLEDSSTLLHFIHLAEVSKSASGMSILKPLDFHLHLVPSTSNTGEAITVQLDSVRDEEAENGRGSKVFLRHMEQVKREREASQKLGRTQVRLLIYSEGE